MPDTIEIEGRLFTPADLTQPDELVCATTNKRSQQILTLKDDDLFLITDTLGNISSCIEDEVDTSLGLFCRDTRFLNRLELHIEGQSPILLSSTAQKGFALSVLCANPQIDNRIKAETIGFQREIVLNGGLFEELSVTNYSTHAVNFELTLSFDADFADLFEVRGAKREHRGQLLRPVDESSELVESPEKLTLAYQGMDGELMESHILFSHHHPDLVRGKTAVWKLSLQSHETQLIGYRMLLLTDNRPASMVSAPMTLMQAKAAESMEENEWCDRVTRIRSDNRSFNRVIEQAEQDIYLLRQTFGTDKDKVLAAGVPWFSTLFGRDALIAASQSLILDSSIARQTLTSLAHYQGKVVDDWREEEPGKILHELRLGEMARCNEIPHTPYYGTVDATPLWLMLYAEYYAWTQDQETLEKLWPNALAAMEWIDRQCEKTGYLSYQRRSNRGLFNQGWKDSEDCIVDRHGRMAVPAIALCEVQAYVYSAKVRLSEMARMKKRIDLADRWQDEARDLKTRFNRDFWVSDHEYCALALDGEGNPVDSITSNPGHCLSLGILSPEKAQSVAERLRAPDMFSGWGIRTLSSLSPAYNPMGYHVGSVWPHDNGIIAAGLRSLGLVDQALEVAKGLMDMTLEQPYQRPPELFCGYERTPDGSPVRYPVACSPQAWATGTIFQLLRMMINLVPNAPINELRVIDPKLPDTIDHLSLKNLQIGQTLLDLDFERSNGTTACRVTKKRGNLRVVIEA